MKTDAEIKQDILAALQWLPHIDETQFGVIVEDGIVTLTGIVNNFLQKVSAKNAVKDVLEVKALTEQIEVKYGDAYKKTDKEIAKAAATTIAGINNSPKDQIKIYVQDGFIYLSGNVINEDQRNVAKQSVQNLFGVKGVINNLEISNTIDQQLIAEKILQALERSANLEAKGIRVQVDEDTVQLKGRVHSIKEREEAEKEAYNIPGVRKVQNDLVIQYHPEFLK
tara:strand:- start:38 stop:709 length:672 start_codon:yes stop_codon:yes gene_type:complete